MKNKKIYRNQTNELVAGVCSGLADYFEVDATLVRIVFVVLGIGGGSGVLIYLVLWFVIP
ncbi:MAG TPA: PspC domain-containing protein, partial [Candidatus Woesebacteria bacterium]|nr:PspC domain-containing protein [Candidatus Woesebacteria bacterium]